MRATHKKQIAADRGPVSRPLPDARLILGYTLLFALFFVMVFSPFRVYGRAFLYSSDGTSQNLPELTYTRQWLRTIWRNLRDGRLQIPFWDLRIGFGMNTVGTAVSYRLGNSAFALFSEEMLEPYMILRVVVYLYLSGICFLIYARTRVRDRLALLTGMLLYTFSGFTIFFSVRHFFFLALNITLPLLLLGVDQIFDGRFSWLFVLTVAVEAFTNFYLTYMLTLPAVIYAFFHYFEFPKEERVRRGGFWRILLRHVGQYLIGVALGAVGLLPNLILAFDSSRVAAQQGTSLLHWDGNVYANFVRAVADMSTVGIQGYIGLSSVGFFCICHLFYARRKKGRLLRGQLLVYTAAFLIPALTMVFSAFSGKTQRWCYMFAFWAALAAAYALPGLMRDRGPGKRFCLYAVLIYAALYLAVTVWTVREVSVCLVMLLVGGILLTLMLRGDWGRRHKRRFAGALFALLLVEMTAKSYSLYAPQYGNYISSFIEADNVKQIGEDNAADALELANDDGLYRTDVITDISSKVYQTNYGARNRVNGVSSYYSYTDAHVTDYSLELGNSQQTSLFKIMDLDQRTVLDELAGVRYAAALDDGLNRIPYGYEQVASREKTLSDGSVCTEYLFENPYALCLSYAYDACIPREEYLALPFNEREQAMLQGVVVESDVPLKKADLSFDDEVVLGHKAFLSALKKAAEKSDKLEVTEDGVLRVKADGCSVSLPVKAAQGEICLLIEGLEYTTVDFDREEVKNLIRSGAPRADILSALRRSRKWTPKGNSLLTVTSGDLKGRARIEGTQGQYYFGRGDMLINLGYGELGKKVRIKFSAAGEYRFDRVRLIVQPMDSYAEKVAPLLARQAEDVQIDGDRVTVRYDLNEQVLACLAIPCSSSWSATVDGEPAQILPANGMYMGVMLSPGEHTIVFRYAMRGLREGAVITLLTAAGLLICIVLRRKRRPRRPGAGKRGPRGRGRNKGASQTLMHT